jgi:hypothetical protein
MFTFTFSLASGNVEQQRRTLVARRHTNKSELLTDAVAMVTEDDDKLNAPEIDYTFNVHAVTQAVWHSLHGFDSGHAPLFGLFVFNLRALTFVYFQHHRRLVVTVNAVRMHGLK